MEAGSPNGVCVDEEQGYASPEGWTSQRARREPGGIREGRVGCQPGGGGGACGREAISSLRPWRSRVCLLLAAAAAAAAARVDRREGWRGNQVTGSQKRRRTGVPGSE